MKENLNLFLPDHAEKHESIMKKKIRKFILAYKLLDQFLSMEINPDDANSLQFYSNIYVDMAPLLTEITCFVINNGYSGRRVRVDNAILISQKVLGLLKFLHLRYMISITSQDPILDFRWYQVSDKSNSEIVGEIAKLFDSMYSLKLKG